MIRTEKESEGRRYTYVKNSKVVKNCVFLIIYNSGGSNSGLSWPDKKKKIKRRCGAVYKSKSKCTKCINFEPLLQVET